MTEEKKSSTNYVMDQSSPSIDENQIDLLKLIRTLLHAWKTIVGITILCIGLAVAHALHAPEVYKAEILLAPSKEEKPSTSSALSQFGGLAAMAGISIPSDSNVEQILATLQSRKFLRQYIIRKKLLPVFFEEFWDSENQAWIVENEKDKPSEQKAVEILKSCLSVGEDHKSGLIKLSVLWRNPNVAAEWANDLVTLLNEQLRSKAISESHKRVGYLEKELAKTTLRDMRNVLYSLLESEKQKAMLANVNEDFALVVIDPAIAPEYREKPKRKVIVALGGICGLTIGVFAVFLFQFFQKLKTVKIS